MEDIFIGDSTFIELKLYNIRAVQMSSNKDARSAFHQQGRTKGIPREAMQNAPCKTHLTSLDRFADLVRGQRNWAELGAKAN